MGDGKDYIFKGFGLKRGQKGEENEENPENSRENDRDRDRDDRGPAVPDEEAKHWCMHVVHAEIAGHDQHGGKERGEECSEVVLRDEALRCRWSGVRSCGEEAEGVHLDELESSEGGDGDRGEGGEIMVRRI